MQRLGYLISQYPAVNHTFILREVRQLRELGVDIRVASIRSVDRAWDALVHEEQDEFRQTHYINQSKIGRIIADHLATWSTRPFSYVKSLFYAVKVARFRPRQSLRHLAYLSQAVLVGRWMKREGLTHAHTHFSSTVALFLSKIFPVSFSVTIHGPDEFRDPRGFLLREKVESALFVCAISDFARLQLQKCAPQCEWNKIDVTRLGVDLSVFNPRPPRLAPRPLEILCVGRLAPAKAQHVLIGASEKLIREGREVRLTLVGDGPDRKKLEKQVQERNLAGHVILKGSLNQKRVRELYAQADVFALSSFAEGVPVVLMEAMAMEIPCVATRVAGVSELIRDEIDGLLVEPGDDESLARAIARLHDDPALGVRLGQSARQHVNQEYNLRKNVERLAEVFSNRLGWRAKELAAF